MVSEVLYIIVSKCKKVYAYKDIFCVSRILTDLCFDIYLLIYFKS
jgi:hypothetical protein